MENEAPKNEAPAPALDGAAAVAADVLAAAPDVSDRAGEIEKQLTGKPSADPEAPYGRLKNGKPRKEPKRERDNPSASVLPDDREAKRVETAGAMVDMVTGMFGALFDPDEWKPSEAEHRTLTHATARFMDSRNLDDLPPGIALVIAFGLYAVPRLAAKEKTKTKVGAFFGWVGKLWQKR